MEKTLISAYEKGYRVTKDGVPQGIDVIEKSEYVGDTGYLCFSVKNRYGHNYIHTHRLQAYQKFGEKIFDDDIQVRHLNGNKKDNSWSNISIGTQSDNMMDRPKKQRMRQAKYANEKVSNKEAIEIRERVESGNYETYKKLAEEYNLKSKSSIHYIVHDKKIGIG